MTKILFVIISLLLVITRHTMSQEMTLSDSLLFKIASAKEDTFKAKLLFRMMFLLMDSNKTEESMIYCKEVMSLSEKIGWRKGIMHSNYYLGRYCWQKGNFELALILHKRALELARELGDKEQIALALTSIGQDYGDNGNYHEALTYFNKAKDIYIELHDTAMVANAHLLKSWAYDNLSNYPESSKENIEALKLYEAIKNNYGVGIANANVAIDFIKLRRYEEAIPYLLNSNKVYLKNSDYINLSGNYIVLSDCYIKLKNIPAALESAKKSLKNGEKIKDIISIGNGYSQIGKILFSQNNFEAAAENYKLAVKSFQTVKANRLLGDIYASLALCYLRLNKPGIAKTFLDSTRHYTGLYESNTAMEKYYNGSQSLDSLQGNWKGAYLNYYKYVTIRDSLSNEDVKSKLMQYNMQYEYDKKEAIAKAEQEKKDIRERNIRNSISAGLAGALIFLVVVSVQRNKISRARKRSDELLLNILPEEVAEELKEKGNAEARQFDNVTVMFTDFKGFTKISEKLSPKELVSEIDTCFKAFDNIIGKYNIEKIKTIGDSYMCVGGLPLPESNHAENVVKAALEINQFMNRHIEERKNSGKEIFEIRIGIHSGPVVAGIVGVKKFAYDIWGDTVNLASRMESSGEPGKINISGATYEFVKDKFNCLHRGKITAKNKGEIDMYFVIS